MDTWFGDCFTFAGIATIALLMWAWYCHCFFFFHRWDKSRCVTDVCTRCGAVRILKVPRGILATELMAHLEKQRSCRRRSDHGGTV